MTVHRVPRKVLTLLVPTGGIIRPAPKENLCHIFIGRNFFFNLWWLFKFKPLTNPSEVRFFIYYKKFWKICYQKYLVSSNFDSKIWKKVIFSHFFTKTKHFPHKFESYITSAFYKPLKCIIFPPGGFVAVQSARPQQ